MPEAVYPEHEGWLPLSHRAAYVLLLSQLRKSSLYVCRVYIRACNSGRAACRHAGAERNGRKRGHHRQRTSRVHRSCVRRTRKPAATRVRGVPGVPLGVLVSLIRVLSLGYV